MSRRSWRAKRQFPALGKRSTRLSRRRDSLPHGLNPLDHELKPVPAPLRAGYGFFDIEVELRIVELFADFFHVRMNLGVDEKKLSAETGLQKQLLVENAGQHEGSHNVPVAADLAQPVVFRSPRSPNDFHEIVGALRKEFHAPPIPGFAHLGFAAQIVEFKNQVSVSGSGLLSHWGISPSAISVPYFGSFLWTSELAIGGFVRADAVLKRRLRRLPNQLLPAEAVRAAHSRILYWGRQSPGRPSDSSRPDIRCRSWGISRQSACAPR